MTSTELLSYGPTAMPAEISVPAFWARTEKAGERSIGFFTSNIRNPHRRRADFQVVGSGVTHFANSMA